MSTPTRILYCHCTYAQVVPKEVKEAVLKRLCESGPAFEAVADLWEMSARQDIGLKRLTEGGTLKIAACYPPAVKWLFASAKAPLDVAATEVLNMRVETAEEVIQGLLRDQIVPNVPAGKITAPSPGELPEAATAPAAQTTPMSL